MIIYLACKASSHLFVISAMIDDCIGRMPLSVCTCAAASEAVVNTADKAHAPTALMLQFLVRHIAFLVVTDCTVVVDSVLSWVCTVSCL
jgi:hypothetical protein